MAEPTERCSVAAGSALGMQAFVYDPALPMPLSQ